MSSGQEIKDIVERHVPPRKAARTVEHEAALDVYRNLVFSPLALPSPPAVDTAALIEWMQWARVEGHKRGLNRPERNYESRTGRRYPWLSANVRFYEPSEIRRSFELKFSEIVEYCDAFPVKRVGALAFLAQHGGLDVHMHADSDGYWGLRFYLANKNCEGLHFYMARVDPLPRGTDALPQYVDPKKHYARWPTENRPYCVNSMRAAHAVDSNTCTLGERIVCALFHDDGGHDEKKLLSLLEASSAQFGEYQIWHKG